MDQHTNNKPKQPEGPPKDFLIREQWFPTDIWFVDHPTPEKTNAKLIKDIDRWYDRNQEGIVRSNALGWHSAVDMHHRSKYNHFTKWLFEKVNEVFKGMSYHPETEAFCDNMWANMNMRYSHNRNHVHPGALWSGVYYIRCPKDSGRIWFTDPRGEAHCMIPRFGKNKDRSLWREVYYEPVPGRLVLFPGWLTHEVEHNLNKEFEEDDRRGWRYSLSFNFVQRNKVNFKPKERKGHDSGGGVFMSDLEIADE
jgi:uncharacterized protein (TIGR02466 family)